MGSVSRRSFFRMVPDYEGFMDQWFLSDPLTNSGCEIDALEFTEAIRYRGPLPASVPVGNPGRELGVNFGPFDYPVVSTVVAETVCRIAPEEVECFPVVISGAKRSYVILNATVALDCLDETKSEFTRWTEADGRPDRLGQYQSIPTMRVDGNRTANHHIFRIKGWTIALLVSDTLRDALEGIPDLGVIFTPV